MSFSHRKILILTVSGVLLLHPGARSVTLSFLCALLLAGCVQRVIDRAEAHHVPRWLTTLGLAALVLLPLLALLLWSSLEALQKIQHSMNGLLNSIGSTDWMKEWMARLTTALPPRLQDLVGQLMNEENQRTMVIRLLSALAQAVSSLLSALPGKLAGVGLLLLFFIFCAIGYPEVTALLRGLLPKDWWRSLGKIKATLTENFRLWGTAQCKVVCLIALELTLGLCLLRAEHPVALALLIALVDLIPLIGSGLILLPWAGISFLSGSTAFALGLVLLWALAWGTRTILEPKLVGKHLQLPGAVSLFSAVLGASVWGFKGLILFPVLTSAAAALLKRRKGTA